MRFSLRPICVAVAIALHAPIASAAGTPIDQASKAQLRAAQKTFEAASDLYDAGRFEEAITAFRASHDIVASPNSRLMIARALMELKRVDEAYEEYKHALEDATGAASRDERYTKTRDAVAEELREVEGKVARVTVSVENAPEGTQVVVGDRTIEGSALERPVVVLPGEVSFAARAPSGREVRQTLNVPAGALEAVTLRFEDEPVVEPPPQAPPEEPVQVSADTDEPSSLRPWAYVAGGVGVAGLAAFSVFGVLNNSKFSELEDGCPDDHCTPDREGDIDDGRRFQTFANIGLIVGVVGVGASATLFVLSSGSSDSETAKTAPRVGVGPGSVVVRGRF